MILASRMLKFLCIDLVPIQEKLNCRICMTVGSVHKRFFHVIYETPLNWCLLVLMIYNLQIIFLQNIQLIDD